MSILTTSSPSPTFGPAAPSPRSFHIRPYNASYLSPTSHSPRQSRQQPSVTSSARVEATSTSTSTTTPSTPAAPEAHASPTSNTSPVTRRTADAATQYTPPDLPPTSRPTTKAQPAGAAEEPSVAKGKRREVSSSPSHDAKTEPPEPVSRADPQPFDGAPAALPEDAPTNARPNATQIPAAKRARPSAPEPKVMPIKYETCDVKDLGVLISDMLMELVRLNDNIPLRDGQLTRFHSRAPPGISVRDYLNRLIVHATLSPPILLSMVYYIEKLCALFPTFTISSLTVHRFLITAATVAAKGLSDAFWTNPTYARVGGVSVRELALLELEFLERVEWRIVPKPETLVDYYQNLIERNDGYVIEKEPASDRDGMSEGAG
ncbi:hypothetical protein LTR04_000857 [Oleoguttula sp. CCFEE 6159]|nr:hypothetical protein LTR04_000857 [Oleoguttula sp. CCFEE 6159]